MHKHRILFIHCKHRSYGVGGYTFVSSGLGNSVKFIVDMLKGLGIEADRVEVTDNNDIDREVTKFRPTDCFIEAFWVVPEKFDILRKLHPSVRWIVREHSATPFLSQEGIALQWVAGYLQRGIEVNANSKHAYQELKIIAHQVGVSSDQLVSYLPNYYPQPGADSTVVHPQPDPRVVNVGCFGAIRSLKNQLEQAVAACAFADNERMKLRFHVNVARQEGWGAAPILTNLRSLFAMSRHELVEHPWMPHGAFLSLMGKMDLAMQVSFSETFNIVAADAVVSAVPVVVSPQVSWLGHYAQAIPGDAKSIVRALHEAWDCDSSARLFRQRADLAHFLTKSEHIWNQRFGWDA